MNKEQFNDKLEDVNIVYQSAVKHYIELFCEKQECYLEFQSSNLLCFGDNFFNLEDIILDLNKNCKKGLIFKWQNKGIDVHTKYPDLPQINYNSYIMGYRYKDLIRDYLKRKSWMN